MGGMDTAAAQQPTVWLKIPFNGTTIRTRPFEGKHLTAMKMAQTLRADDRKVNMMLRTLGALLGDETYEIVITAILDDEVELREAVSGLLSEIVTASEAYHKAQAAKSAVPADVA